MQSTPKCPVLQTEQSFSLQQPLGIQAIAAWTHSQFLAIPPPDLLEFRRRQRNRCSLDGNVWRKVRAPQDTMVGNTHRPRGPGKCNRKQTAERWSRTDLSVHDRVVVRVKRCGKSAPAVWVTGWLGKPHREQGQAEGTATLLPRTGPVR